MIQQKSRIKHISPRMERHMFHHGTTSKAKMNVQAQPWYYRGIYRTYDEKRFYYHSYYFLRKVADQEAKILRDKGNHVRVSKEKAAKGVLHYVIWVRRT